MVSTTSTCIGFQTGGPSRTRSTSSGHGRSFSRRAHPLGVAGEDRHDDPGRGVGPPLADDEVGGEVAGRPVVEQRRRVRPELRGTARTARAARRGRGRASREGRWCVASARDRPSSSMEEQWTFNPLVQGSSPWGGTAHRPRRGGQADRDDSRRRLQAIGGRRESARRPTARSAEGSADRRSPRRARRGSSSGACMTQPTTHPRTVASPARPHRSPPLPSARSPRCGPTAARPPSSATKRRSSPRWPAPTRRCTSSSRRSTSTTPTPCAARGRGHRELASEHRRRHRPDLLRPAHPRADQRPAVDLTQLPAAGRRELISRR